MKTIWQFHLGLYRILRSSCPMYYILNTYPYFLLVVLLQFKYNHYHSQMYTVYIIITMTMTIILIIIIIIIDYYMIICIIIIKIKTWCYPIKSTFTSWDDCCLWGCALPLHWFVRLNGGEVWWLIIYNTPLPLHGRRLQFFYLQNNSLWSMGNTQHHLMN